MAKFKAHYTLSILLVFKCLLMPLLIRGQTIEIDNSEFKDNKLFLYYSIVDSTIDRSYTVRIYSSIDGFLNPLEGCLGDVGLEVKGGLNKKIVIDPMTVSSMGVGENITFEIRAKIFLPFINTESINQYKVFKRLMNYNLTWTGGSSQNVLNFDLVQDERKIATFPNIGNAGHHSFKFPSHVKPGKAYRFRISDAKNKDEVVYTAVFRIRRKFPLVLKILPTFVLGYLIFYSSQSNQKTAVDSDIPVAPNPPK